MAFQQYNTSGLGEHLGANGKGAQEDVVLADMGRVAPEESPVWKDSQQAWDQVLGEIKNQDAIEWLVQDERGQRVLATLAQDIGTKAAKWIFRRIFFRKRHHIPQGTRSQCQNWLGLRIGLHQLLLVRMHQLPQLKATVCLLLTSNQRKCLHHQLSPMERR